MATEIRMPELSQATDEIKILRWLKNTNDFVKKGEPLLEVETDKVTMEVESFCEGYVKKICCEAEQTVTVGTLIAYVGDKDEEISETTKTAERVPPTNTAPAETPRTRESKEGAPQVSAMARNLARKLNVDLSAVSGTGPGGLITREDVLNYVKQTAAPRIEMSMVEKTTAKRLTTSKTTIPHFYVSTDVDASQLIATRNEINKGLSDDEKVPMDAFLVRAAALALADYPRMNAVFGDGQLTVNEEKNIAAAVSVEAELFVPVVTCADTKSIKQIGQEIRTLADKARQHKLKQEDVSGGTFTITNLGMYDVSSFIAVIDPLQSAILAISRAKPTPTVTKEGTIASRPIMVLTLSVDHRVAHGAIAAEFLGRIKELIENPSSMTGKEKK